MGWSNQTPHYGGRVENLSLLVKDRAYAESFERTWISGQMNPLTLLVSHMSAVRNDQFEIK